MSDLFDKLDEAVREARADMPRHARTYACRDKTCGGPDCRTCFGRWVAQAYADEQQGDQGADEQEGEE